MRAVKRTPALWVSARGHLPCLFLEPRGVTRGPARVESIYPYHPSQVSCSSAWLIMDDADEEMVEEALASPPARQFPLYTHQAAALVRGVVTEVLITEYADRFFVVITQREKLGTFVSRRRCLLRGLPAPLTRHTFLSGARHRTAGGGQPRRRLPGPIRRHVRGEHRSRESRGCGCPDLCAPADREHQVPAPPPPDTLRRHFF